MGNAGRSIWAGLAAVLALVTGVRADIAPKPIEVVMVATVVEARGGGSVRQLSAEGPLATRSFTLADLPGFPLAPGAAISLGWQASGIGLIPFFDEDGMPICQPFRLGGVSPGVPRDPCTNAGAGATLLFASLPFADRLDDEPMAAGPNVYLSDYHLDLVYTPSTFWSPACCAYEYDWDDGLFERKDAPGLFERAGRPHSANGSFEGRRGWLTYRFDIDGDNVEGLGVANIQFAVDWRFRNYDTTGVPAPAGTLLLGLGLIALQRRRG